MRRLILALPLVLLVMAPTGVQAAAGDLVVCDAPPEGTTVIKPGEAPSVTEPAPPAYDPLFYTYTDTLFQLDLYPATATDTATVTSTLTWDLDVNNWDLYLLDGDGLELDVSEGFQAGPAGDAATETVSKKLTHCSLFTVSVENEQGLIASADVDPLNLATSAGSVVTP
jgi:hypothetical protein